DAVDHRDRPTVLALVRVRSRPTVLCDLAGRLAGRADGLAGQRAEIPEAPATAQEDEREEHDDADDPPAAAERDRQPAGQPAGPLTTVVLDLRGVELRVLAESHARNVPTRAASGTRLDDGLRMRVGETQAAASTVPPSTAAFSWCWRSRPRTKNSETSTPANVIAAPAQNAFWKPSVSAAGAATPDVRSSLVVDTAM